MAPFYDPNGVLIDWKDGAGWTLTDALAGCLTTGSIGSGKSTGPGAMLSRAFLRSTTALPGGMGAIFFYAKNGEATETEQLCQRLGRGQDVIRITPGGRYGFNFMQWIADFGEGGERGPLPTVALLEEIASVINPQSGSDKDPFWKNATRLKLTNHIMLAQLARLPVTLDLMLEISASAPETLEQMQDRKWREGSVMWHALREAEAATANDPAARRDYHVVRQYFLTYAKLDNRPKSSIETMFEQLITPFLCRPLRPLLAEHTNVTPEMCFEGRILLVDVPVQEFGLTARICAVAFKRCAQLAIMKRHGPPGSLRPVVLYADEAQAVFLSPADADYQCVSRSAGGVTCLLTQQISSIREALGSEDKAENLISNLQTKFFCQNSGETARYAEQLLGEREVDETDISIGRSASVQAGVMGDASSSGGLNRKKVRKVWFEASKMQQFRRGGAANDYKVDALVFAGGKMFAGEKGPQPFKILGFPQR